MTLDQQSVASQPSVKWLIDSRPSGNWGLIKWQLRFDQVSIEALMFKLDGVWIVGQSRILIDKVPDTFSTHDPAIDFTILVKVYSD